MYTKRFSTVVVFACVLLTFGCKETTFPVIEAKDPVDPAVEEIIIERLNFDVTAAHHSSAPLAGKIEVLSYFITREGPTYYADVQYNVSGSLGTQDFSGVRHIRITYKENGEPTGEAVFQDTSF